ncbi:MAG: filamentous hemagglutinin, partial [Candidatus Methylumidiphilus sp.]
ASTASINLAGAAVSGRQASDAGSLDILARTGVFNWNGTISARNGAAAPGLAQGRITLDAASLGEFPTLLAQLGAAGFNEAVSLRQTGLGGFAVGAADTLAARQIELLAEQGAVNIDGTLDASGPDGGSVLVYGRDGIRLGASALLDAHATAAGGVGGNVKLDTVHRDDVGFGLLDLSAESAQGRGINVAGGAGGQVHLRSGRGGASDMAAVNARIDGAAQAVYDATAVYADQSIIGSADNPAYVPGQWLSLESLRDDTAQFMAVAQAPGGTTKLTLLPGIEVRGSGNLSLQDRWDFMDGYWLSDPNDFSGIIGSWQPTWRYADSDGKPTLPGFLTLRAGGDLNINASLTDAFATAPIPGLPSFLRFQDLLQPGQSWSYDLVAGRNVNLAARYSGLDPADPQPGVYLKGLQVMVRTGTGSIDIQAQGDIRFLADIADPNDPDYVPDPHIAAAVYTMGQPAGHTVAELLQQGIAGVPTRNPGETQADYFRRLDPALLDGLLRYGLLDVSFDGVDLPAARFLAEYPTRGGAVRLAAGGSIYGIDTGQLSSDWLVRNGTWNTASADSPTAWGINVSGDFANEAAVPSTDGSYFYFAKGNRRFNQNVGVLGGGTARVTAGGDIWNLSVMAPSTGKPLGVWAENRRWLSNAVAVNGGGDVFVKADGDIVGGDYLAGRGTAQLTAGGRIASAANGIGALLEVGDARVSAQARGDVNLGAAFNPTVAKQAKVGDPLTSEDAYFFSFGPDSALSLLSLAGDVALQNDVRAVKLAKGMDANLGSGFEFTVYPATVQAAALAGDIRIGNSFTLFPAPNGKLELLAANNIGTEVLNRRINVNVSDADPARLPGPANPAQALDGSLSDRLYLARERLDPMTPDSAIIHAATPIHQNDGTRSSVIAAKGDIAFPATTPFWWYLPHESTFQAGRDIRNLSWAAQNLRSSDISLIQAGRDLRYDTPLDAEGQVLGIDRKIQLGGPGQLQLLTGRNFNLGSSTGVLSVGNLANSALPSASGADISLLAGPSDRIDLAGFFERYFGPAGAYRSQLDTLALPEYGITLALSRDDKLALLKDLPQPAVLRLAEQILFTEIKQSTAAAAAEADESKRLKL